MTRYRLRHVPSDTELVLDAESESDALLAMVQTLESKGAIGADFEVDVELRVGRAWLRRKVASGRLFPTTKPLFPALTVRKREVYADTDQGPVRLQVYRGSKAVHVDVVSAAGEVLLGFDGRGTGERLQRQVRGELKAMGVSPRPELERVLEEVHGWK